MIEAFLQDLDRVRRQVELDPSWLTNNPDLCNALHSILLQLCAGDIEQWEGKKYPDNETDEQEKFLDDSGSWWDAAHISFRKRD